MKELIRFDDETQRTFLKEVSPARRSQQEETTQISIQSLHQMFGLNITQHLRS